MVPTTNVIDEWWKMCRNVTWRNERRRIKNHVSQNSLGLKARVGLGRVVMVVVVVVVVVVVISPELLSVKDPEHPRNKLGRFRVVHTC